MFEARIAELNRFNEQNPVSYDKRTYTAKADDGKKNEYIFLHSAFFE